MSQALTPIPSAPISNMQFFKALKNMIKRNLHFKILTASIRPDNFKVYFAVKEKNDIEQKWYPRIVVYKKSIKKLYIFNSLSDKNPKEINAATILHMDEAKIIKQD
jgi:hypothetical protein